MWVEKERNCKKGGVPCVMTVLVSTILLVCVFPSYAQALTADFRHSETCYGTGNCSLHDLRCEAGSRLAVLQASYGFKPKQIADACVSEITGDVCPQHCCRYNSSSDCQQDLSANNMQLLQSECSHSASCQIRAQRGDNIYCNTVQRGITSTVSVLRAVCVPDATTVNPCSNSTVSGHSVSLFLSAPAPSSPCQCTLHKTNTTPTNNNNNNDKVDFYAYEVESSTAGWEMRVENRNGSALKTLKGVVKLFPAVSVSSPGSSLPLTLTVSVSNLSDSPHRVWLGFRGAESSVTLRCGQDAIDHTMSLTTTTPIPTTTTAPATTPLETTTTTATTSSNTTSNATTTMMVPSTTSKEPTSSTAGASGAASMPLTSEDPQKATKDYNDTLSGDPDEIASTDVIAYVAVGVSALILCAFIYVCVRRLRKKGCPHWCPPACQHLECAKGSPQSSARGSGSRTSGSAASGEGRRRGSQDGGVSANGGSALSNGRLGNGHVSQLTGGGRDGGGGDGGGIPFAFTQRRCSFEHIKRHRGSVQSLRRASFSNLEDIKETEEDGEEDEEDDSTTTPTTHRHRSNHLHPYNAHHLPIPPEEQEDIIKIVEEHIATIVDETNNNSSSSDDKNSDDDSDSVFNPGKSTVTPQGAAEALNVAAGKDNPPEGQQGGASVVFRLGGSESSDPDLEHQLTKL